MLKHITFFAVIWYGALALDQPECYQARGSCQGDLYSLLKGIESENDCLKNCRGQNYCAWYTYNFATRTCFLFENCPDIDENCLNCLTGQKLCPYFPGPGEPNKLLVIGGTWWNNPEIAYETEVLDLDDPAAKCRVVEFFPAHTVSSTGAFLNGRNIFTCGGFLEDNGITDHCYNLGVEEPVANMQVPRQNAASLAVNGETQLWVTGGLVTDPIFQRWSTTEFVSPDGSSYYGPDLPYAMEKHCLVRLNSSTAMLIGGYNREEGGYRNTFFYDFNSETFTKGPDSLEHRENHACGVIRDTGDGSMIVVAVGGSSHTSSSSELFFEGTEEWTTGPEIPNHPTYKLGGITAADGERFIVAGGGYLDDMGAEHWYNVLFELQCTNKVCEWTKMEQKLMFGRRDHVLMLIPDSLVYCEQPEK